MLVFCLGVDHENIHNAQCQQSIPELTGSVSTMSEHGLEFPVESDSTVAAQGSQVSCELNTQLDQLNLKNDVAG